MNYSALKIWVVQLAWAEEKLSCNLENYIKTVTKMIVYRGQCLELALHIPPTTRKLMNFTHCKRITDDQLWCIDSFNFNSGHRCIVIASA